MTSKRRMGKQTALSRAAFLDATEALLQREGSAAVTAGQVAKEAGLTKQLLFYYFKNMDELIKETFLRQVEFFRNGSAEALEDKHPLRALWRFEQLRNSRLFTELMSMAGRDPSLRDEIARMNRESNDRLIEGLKRLRPKEADIDPITISPNLLVFLLSSIARNLAIEKDLGLLQCGEELDEFLEWCLNYFDPLE